MSTWIRHCSIAVHTLPNIRCGIHLTHTEKKSGGLGAHNLSTCSVDTHHFRNEKTQVNNVQTNLEGRCKTSPDEWLNNCIVRGNNDLRKECKEKASRELWHLWGIPISRCPGLLPSLSDHTLSLKFPEYPSHSRMISTMVKMTRKKQIIKR